MSNVKFRMHKDGRLEISGELIEEAGKFSFLSTGDLKVEELIENDDGTFRIGKDSTITITELAEGTEF